VLGLTIRIGRQLTGHADRLLDLVAQGKSILLLGPPGTGKTTALREIARLHDEKFQRRVVVVDTSSEICGGGWSPHQSVGSSTRRLLVDKRSRQQDVMVEAVQNHNPEVLIIDEIGTRLETNAAQTIAQRGVILGASAHGRSLEQMIRNPDLTALCGGVESVTRGDQAASRGDGRKQIDVRKREPVFDVVVELRPSHHGGDVWFVHTSVGDAVDSMLRGKEPLIEKRGASFSPAATASSVKQSSVTPVGEDRWASLLGEAEEEAFSFATATATSSKSLEQAPTTTSSKIFDTPEDWFASLVAEEEAASSFATAATTSSKSLEQAPTTTSSKTFERPFDERIFRLLQNAPVGMQTSEIADAMSWTKDTKKTLQLKAGMTMNSYLQTGSRANLFRREKMKKKGSFRWFCKS